MNDQSLEMLIKDRLRDLLRDAESERRARDAQPEAEARQAAPCPGGFPLFTWLLSEMPVQNANTASYAAPVIALGLGRLLLAEQVTPRTLGGVAVILVGVALIVWSSSRTRGTTEREPERLVELEELAA